MPWRTTRSNSCTRDFPTISRTAAAPHVPMCSPVWPPPPSPMARSHIAFGRGIHTCPGAPLARAEARVALERLLDRTTDIRIDERVHGPADARGYHYLPTFILRGLTALHLELTVAEGEAR